MLTSEVLMFMSIVNVNVFLGEKYTFKMDMDECLV